MIVGGHGRYVSLVSISIYIYTGTTLASTSSTTGISFGFVVDLNTGFNTCQPDSRMMHSFTGTIIVFGSSHNLFDISTNLRTFGNECSVAGTQSNVDAVTLTTTSTTTSY